MRVQRHALRPETDCVEVSAGSSIAEIVAGLEWSGLPEVSIVGAGRADLVPLELWAKVRPKPGAVVYVHARVRGEVGGAVAGLAIMALAPWAAGVVFPTLAAGSFGLALATTAFTMIGSLAVSALIPPAPQERAGPTGGTMGQRYSIVGTNNELGNGRNYPKVLGRHKIAPPMSATGFTEILDGETYWRGRYTFGYGPLALEDLRVGSTPITEFEGVELEFVNVDKEQTLALMPVLDRQVRAWRSGTEALELYPSDVSQEAINAKMEYGAAGIVRNTLPDTLEAVVVIGFPQGLYRPKTSSAGIKDAATSYTIEFREAGSGDEWTLFKDVLFTDVIFDAGWLERHAIEFPFRGEWEIRVTKTMADYASGQGASETTFSGLQSYSGRALPSHAGIAEVAVRIKATDQINGRLDNLTAIVQQLAPVYDGASWSAPVPVRHPAWVFADVLTGTQLGARALPRRRLEAEALREWAELEPHWTCDYFVETEATVREILDIVAGAGRAKFSLKGYRYGVIREGAGAEVRQVFTPANTWGLSWQVAIPRAVHALRIPTVSEPSGWLEDIVTVYADGHDATTATEFETLETPGVIVSTGDATQGNNWRLGRYHLAVAQHRRETFSFYADWEHLRVTHGDKVLLNAPVAKIHYGAGRVVSANASRVRLDEPAPMAGALVRLRHRASSGEVRFVLAEADAEDLFLFRFDGAPGFSIEAGDLVAIEDRNVEAFEALVSRIEPADDLSAQITVVSAAPAVLEADGGEIPAYEPIITEGDGEGAELPKRPEVVGIESDRQTARVTRTRALVPRVAVAYRAKDFGARQYVRLRWIEEAKRKIAKQEIWRDVDAGFEDAEAELDGGGVGDESADRDLEGDRFAVLEELQEIDETGDLWVEGTRQPAGAPMQTGDLTAGVEYRVQICAENQVGESRGWVNAGLIVASVKGETIDAPSGWYGEPDIASVTLRGERSTAQDFAFFAVYGALPNDDTLRLVDRVADPFCPYVGPFRRFKVCQVDNDGDEGALTDWIEVAPRGIQAEDFSNQGVLEIGAFGPDLSDLIDRAATDASNALQIAQNAVENIGDAGEFIELARDDLNGLIDGLDGAERDITLLQDAVNDPLTGLAAQGSALEGISNRVTTAEGKIETEQRAITALEGAVNDPDTGLAAQGSAATLLTNRVKETEDGLFTAQKAITAIEGTIEDPETGVSAQAQALSGLKTRVEDPDTGLAAQADALTTLSTTVGEHTTSISEVMQSIDGEKARWAIEIDNDGNISGIELASDGSRTDFKIAADAFKVGVNGKMKAPFVVRTTEETIGGVTYPAGIYLSGDTFVETAQVFGDLKSTNYAAGQAGYRLRPNGISEFNNPVITRDLVLNEGYFEYPGSINSGSVLTLRHVNTGIKIGQNDVWTTASYTLSASARALPLGGGTAISDSSLFSVEARPYNAFKWNGYGWKDSSNFPSPWMQDPDDTIRPDWASGNDQRVLMTIEINPYSMGMVGPIGIWWKVKQVS